MKKSLLSLIPVGIAISVFFSQGTSTALAQEEAKSDAPTISYAMKMEITFTGTLYSSTDGITWTKVEGATSPYLVSLDDAKKMLFCSKEEEPPAKSLPSGENRTIPLNDTVNLDMIWIEPGTFIMGSPEDELGRGLSEIQHEVTLTKGYWMGKYEVTQAQYEAIMGENPSGYKSADLPVVKVGWKAAMDFCAKLTEAEKVAGRLPEGYEYTLPTEAQWEYACRAGTTTAFNNGTDILTEEEIFGVCPNLDEVGWYVRNCRGFQPVGLKKPNAWGLYDMHGNAWEWCLDGEGYYSTNVVTDPLEPPTSYFCILRGGGCNLSSSNVNLYRSAARYSDYKDYDSLMPNGFRVALAPIQ